MIKGLPGNLYNVYFFTVAFRKILFKVLIIHKEQLNCQVSDDYSQKISFFDRRTLCASLQESGDAFCLIISQDVRFAKFFNESFPLRRLYRSNSFVNQNFVLIRVRPIEKFSIKYTFVQNSNLSSNCLFHFLLHQR